MERIISYPITAIYYLVFGLLLVIFHPIQYICLNVFGYQAHKKSVDYLNFGLLSATRILGTRYTIEGLENVPKNVPVIFVVNHQSMYDIITIIWYFRKAHPKFVSKKELGKGIPSVSFNLRHGGSVLIDRKDPKQAIPAIQKLGKYIEANNRAAVIFPEGTRSKTGAPKPFQQTGLKILFKTAPSAYVVPISINNSWTIVKFGFFPAGLGNRLTFTAHKAMKVSDYEVNDLLVKTEAAVTSALIY